MTLIRTLPLITLKQKLLLLTVLACAVNCSAQVIIFKTSNSNISESEIRNELKKYPEKVLKEYLDTIFVINDDRFCGRASMSKHFEICGNCDKEFLKEVIHHEFSSVLLQRYDLYVREVYNELGRKFVELNDKHYQYDDTITNKTIDPQSDASNYFYGSTYAQTGFENDFNTIAQFLFTDGKHVIKVMNDKDGTAIAKKIAAVIRFYNKLDSRFDAKFFQNLSIMH